MQAGVSKTTAEPYVPRTPPSGRHARVQKGICHLNNSTRTARETMALKAGQSGDNRGYTVECRLLAGSTCALLLPHCEEASRASFCMAEQLITAPARNDSLLYYIIRYNCACIR